MLVMLCQHLWGFLYSMYLHWDNFCSSLDYVPKPDSTTSVLLANSIQYIEDTRQENARKFRTKQKYLCFCVHPPPSLQKCPHCCPYACPIPRQHQFPAQVQATAPGHVERARQRWSVRDHQPVQTWQPDW